MPRELTPDEINELLSESSDAELTDKQIGQLALLGRIGATAGTTASAETRSKMSAVRKGRSASAEAKKNLSIALKERNANGPVIWTAERRAKMSKSKTGQGLSAEARLKVSNAMKGRVVSEETRRRISDSKTGKPGTIPSQETRAKMSASMIEASKHISAEAKKNRADGLREYYRLNGGKPTSVETKAKLAAAMSSTRWCNDGVQNKRLRELPEGWVYGKVKKT